MRPRESDPEIFTRYIGNLLLNLNVILFVGCLVYTLVTFTMDYIFAYIFFNSIFFGYVAVSANYFLLSDSYLQIKNYLWFWKGKTYRLDDIKEINIEWPRRGSVAARIIQQDDVSIRFKAGSLWEKDWINFINDLERRGVRVQSLRI